jgi:hypothetical protein
VAREVLVVEDDFGTREALADLLQGSRLFGHFGRRWSRSTELFAGRFCAWNYYPGPDDAGDGWLGVPGTSVARSRAARHPRHSRKRDAAATSSPSEGSSAETNPVRVLGRDAGAILTQQGLARAVFETPITN